MAYCEEHTDKCENLRDAVQSSASAHHRLDRHEVILDRHDAAIGTLSNAQENTKTTVDHLDKRISGLITAVWGLVLVLAAGVVGFIFWSIQQMIVSKGGTP